MATGGSKTQTTTQNNNPWAGAVPSLNLAANDLKDVYNKGMPGYYPGDTTADFTSQQIRGFSGIGQAAPGAQRLSNMGTNTLQDLMGGGPNPYLGKLFDIGQRDISNNVNAQFSKAGRYGSGAQTDVLSRNMGDMWSQMAGGAYENDQNRRLAATDRLAGMYDLSQQGNRDMIGVGSLIQQGQQDSINADMDRYNYGANAERNNVEWLTNLATQLGGVGGTQTGTGRNPNYRSGTENLIGLGSTLGSAWLLSDRRLKTNIRPLGRDEFGMAWYAYRYHWDQPGRVRVGVMADEVPAHAVRMTPAGFATVDYGAL